MFSPLFKINPFRKTLVFHLGSEAGFYSEFNNMVLGILYCNKHRINFKLFSKDATFGLENGWIDYFLPFCEEVKGTFHSIYNKRQPINIPDGYKYNIKKNLYKFFYCFSYYTYELWLNFHNRDFENECFWIDGKNMDIHDASQYVIKEIWKYNEETRLSVDKQINDLLLPLKYAGLHIRRGDKIIEHENESIDKYMSKLQECTSIKDVFVFTDNFEVIVMLKENYPSYTFYTLVEESENGYNHQEFIKRSANERKKAILKMFASVDILSRAEYCIGTFSTNPGMFLGMIMPKGRMIGIDFDSWRIW